MSYPTRRFSVRLFPAWPFVITLCAVLARLSLGALLLPVLSLPHLLHLLPPWPASRGRCLPVTLCPRITPSLYLKELLAPLPSDQNPPSTLEVLVGHQIPGTL